MRILLLDQTKAVEETVLFMLYSKCSVSVYDGMQLIYALIQPNYIVKHRQRGPGQPPEQTRRVS